MAAAALTCRCETVTIGGRRSVVRTDPDCREHGLPVGRSSEPHLRRHSLDGEDDRTVERRLYADAMGRMGPQRPGVGIVGRRYFEPGVHGGIVTVIIQWGCKSRGETYGGPRNVMIERADGTRTVRPFRGLRKLRPRATVENTVRFENTSA